MKQIKASEIDYISNESSFLSSGLCKKLEIV